MPSKSAGPFLLKTVAFICFIGLCALLYSSWIVFAALSVLGVSTSAFFAFVRHNQLQKTRENHTINLETARSHVSKTANLTGAYLLVVLGSGGHTKEMLAMLEIGFAPLSSIHRRYLVSSGDAMSLKQVKAFEEMLLNTHGESEAGTYDVHTVTRARKVHQPLLSTPLTALLSVLEIFPLLTNSPFAGTRSRQKHPDIIITNGPATGFFVGLVAYVLKLFCLAPEDVMQIFYVESWARIKTLSLTGKFFYHTKIADVFLVQHEYVAQRYGVPNAGCLVVDQASN